MVKVEINESKENKLRGYGGSQPTQPNFHDGIIT